jgi:hypothetical protein
MFVKLKQPLLPMSLFKIRNYWVAVIVGSVGQMSFYAMNVLWCKLFTSKFHSQRMDTDHFRTDVSHSTIGFFGLDGLAEISRTQKSIGIHSAQSICA